MVGEGTVQQVLECLCMCTHSFCLLHHMSSLDKVITLNGSVCYMHNLLTEHEYSM